MKKTSSRHRANRLTPSEIRVCQELVYSPRTMKEIAAHLDRSYHTVRTQCERIYFKLSVRSRAELITKIRDSVPDTTQSPPSVDTPTTVSPITRTVVRNCQRSAPPSCPR